ncbi:MAG: MFS transporter [Mycobacteriaceae bacterium]|nr:MFS transporter [Mycobacteriaceae bacterium]
MTDVSPRTSAPPARNASRLVLLIACGATFVAFLDLSVVNIAFPDIRRDFPATSPEVLTWVVSGYAVGFAALLTPAGRLADALGRRRVFVAALAGFAATSLACAVAPDANWLIAARLLQGTTAALMIPAGLGLVLGSTSPDRFGAAIGAWSAAGGFAAVVGPALGGVLVEGFGWRSVFLINVPVGLLIAVLATRVPEIRSGTGTPALPDPVGAAAAALGIGALVAGVTEGQGWGWTSARTLIVLGIGVAMAAVALGRSVRHPSPAVAVGLWRSRRYALVNAASFVFGAAMFAWLLSGPLFLESIWRYSVLSSAGALTVGAVASMVGAAAAGRFTAPSAQRAFAVAGAAMFAATQYWMSTDAFGAQASLWSAWVPAGLLGGSGLGMVVTVLGAAAASSVPPQQFATGVGMNVTARQVGGGLGVAALAAVFAARGHDPLEAFHTLYWYGALATVVAVGLLALPAVHQQEARP